MEKVLLTISEAAQALSIGRTTLRALIRDGQIEAVRIGTAIRVPAAEIERWIESRTGKSH